MSEERIERELHIEADPETVFTYFTDPARMAEWHGSPAELDPRPGGAYRVLVGGRHPSSGEFVEVDPPKRVVFTWGWEGADGRVPAGSTTIEVDLEPDGTGTRLRFVQTGIPGDEIAITTYGWDHYLPRLVEAAAGRDPGPDVPGEA